MKIKELHLTNFRGFEQLDIVFPNRLAVFMGVNGTGKSSVLDAISLYFIQLVEGITMHNIFRETYYETKKDIKIGTEYATLNFRLEYPNLENLDLEILIKNRETVSLPNSDYRTILNYFHKIQEIKNNSEDLPIFIHFQSKKEDERQIQKRKNTEFGSPRLIYDNAFFHSVDNFSDFVTWFKEEEDYEKDIIIAKKNFDAKNFRLEVIRRAISQFLQILDGNIPFSELRISREINQNQEFKSNGKYSLTIKKGTVEFELSQLSEGERTMLMIVCDIARRLTIANPHLKNPLEGEGIVLIDEIDLHLHPQWQREVIPALLATFPNLQFIVTTHSPQVLSKVHKESIFILEDGKLVKNVPNTYGRNASAILFEIFGVTDRPVEVQDKINRCSQLLEEENYKEAKILLKELTDLLGENDEAVVGARTQLLFDNQMVEG